MTQIRTMNPAPLPRPGAPSMMMPGSQPAAMGPPGIGGKGGASKLASQPDILRWIQQAQLPKMTSPFTNQLASAGAGWQNQPARGFGTK